MLLIARCMLSIACCMLRQAALSAALRSGPGRWRPSTCGSRSRAARRSARRTCRQIGAQRPSCSRHADPACADPACADPTWADPTWADPAWADPACADPTWADPAWADPAWADPRLVRCIVDVQLHFEGVDTLRSPFHLRCRRADQSFIFTYACPRVPHEYPRVPVSTPRAPLAHL